MNPIHGSTLPKKKKWPGRDSRACCARDACHPRRARRHLPSFLLYVPVSPVSRADRCKPCPVALVPTLGCSRPLPRSLLLLAFALSGNIIPGYIFCSSKNGPYIRTRLVTPQAKNKHTGSTTPTDAFAPASTSGRPRGGRAQAGSPLSAPMPTHPRRDPGPKRPRAARPKPHTNPIHMCTAITAICCCYCCCCPAAA